MPLLKEAFSMANNKHLSLNDRVTIEKSLDRHLSFTAIGLLINKDASTISKEIRKHISCLKYGSFGRPFNSCVHRYSCQKKLICDRSDCRNKYCRHCWHCNDICPDFLSTSCPKLIKPPYVCNGCSDWNKCTLRKYTYSAYSADKEYHFIFSEAHKGISVSENEIARLDGIISPLILKGQSIHHICSNNADSIMCSEKTIYNYIDKSLFTARNINLPRKVVFKPRKSKGTSFKVDKACRIGRTYDDFLLFLKENPDTPVVELDSVVGPTPGKVLLTIHFTDSLLMLAILRVANTSQSVIDVFERFYWELGPDAFRKLFPVLLCDNGSEFSNPSAIEFDKEGNRRTYIFYCDPSAPYQKGAAENNHEFIRRIIPKGTSFDGYEQSDINLMMSHINSYGRKKLNNRSPYSVFSFLHGYDLLKLVEYDNIPNTDITLLPTLLKK